MAVIQCPSCGYRGEVPDTFRGQQVRCRKCREKLSVPQAWPIVPIAAGVVLLLLAGAGGAFYLLKAEPQDEVVEDAIPVVVDPATQKKDEPVVQPPAILVVKKEGPSAEEVARLQEEARKKAEEERLALEAARLEKERKEREAREEAVKRLALKRNPPLTAHLEEIEKDPTKFLGKCLTVDRVSVKMSAIAKHGELGRFTLGVTSQRGRYFSRVPLGGLVISTSEPAARKLIEKAGPLDVLPRVKLYCEIRQWDRGGKAHPEAFVYRIEVYDSGGQVDAVVEVVEALSNPL